MFAARSNGFIKKSISLLASAILLVVALGLAAPASAFALDASEDAVQPVPSAVVSTKATENTKRQLVEWTRLWGQTQFDTMAKIVQAGWAKNSGGTVILATAGNFPDALSASGVAGLYNAPVLLTNRTGLPAKTKSELARIKPTRVIIAGGPGAIRPTVDTQVKAACGVTPVRCYGNTASDTAAKLNTTYFKKRSSVAILATSRSFYDSLSAAPVSYSKHYPIFLADNASTISANTLSAMKSCGIKQVIVVGGERAITPSIVSKLKRNGISLKQRIGGTTYYDTSRLVAEWGIKEGMSAGNMGVATSYSFYDALCGAALCGKNNAVLVLADDKGTLNANFCAPYKYTAGSANVFGGTSAVGSKTWNLLLESTKIPWQTGSFTVKYHSSDTAAAASATTKVTYGKLTATLVHSSSRLNFKKANSVFSGWHVYREVDKTWLAKNNKGEESWQPLTNGKLPSGYSYVLNPDGVSVSKTAPSGVVHFYAQWISNVVNVTSFGANGSDNADDSSSIQKALDLAKNGSSGLTVKVPKGTYRLDKMLTIYSNTSLELDKDAVMLRTDLTKTMITVPASTVGGYGHAHDITIKGGTWNGNVANNTTVATSASLITIRHAKNVQLLDCTVKESCSRHMVNLSANQNLTVRNVTFANQRKFTGKDTSAYFLKYESTASDHIESFMNMEALHIDYISKDGVSEPTATPLDDTGNKNILVEKCTFKNLCGSGVGSHYYLNSFAGTMSDGITLRSNTFTDVNYIGMHVVGYKNAVIENNTATRTGEMLRINKNTVATSVANNKFVSTTSSKNNVVFPLHGICIYGGSTATVKNNTISATKSNGIFCDELAKVTLQNNTITNAPENGIFCRSTSTVTISGNTIKNAASRGIYCESSHVAISGNEVTVNGSTGLQCIQLNNCKASKSNPLVVKSNTVSGSAKEAGILVKGCTWATIDRNTSTNNYKAGIAVENTTNATVSNNILARKSGNSTVRNGKNGSTEDLTMYGTTTGTYSGNTYCKVYAVSGVKDGGGNKVLAASVLSV